MWHGSNDQLWVSAVKRVYNLRITEHHQWLHDSQRVLT